MTASHIHHQRVGPVAGHWSSLVIQDDSQRPASVSPQDIVHVSNYLPLWVGLSEQPGVDANSIMTSLLSSGGSLPHHNQSIFLMLNELLAKRVT